ncbi:MAG: hypothetical protein LBH79_07050 [Nitrososphaerota archaeon]|jgi:N-acetylneuraminic acid mutarotase|nr:hypothetical protein [Nitrososphaerota archaeon]
MKKTIALLIVFLLTSSFMLLSEPTATAQQTTENTWKSLKPMPDAVPDMAVAVNGQIHVIGDTKHYVYNPIKDKWTTKQPMPTTRHFFGITTYQGKIYTIGGAYWGDGWVASDAVEVYDPKTDSWETKAPIPTARSSLCANEVNGKIYLIGGQTVQAANVDVNEVYDIAANTWTTKKSIPNSVDSYASAVVDGKIYILGGAGGLDLNQIYDPKTDTWSTGAQMPHSTRNAAASATSGLMAPKQICVIGGGPDVYGSCNTQVYNPKTDTWTIGAEMPTRRGWLTTAVVNDIIYAIGGADNFAGPRITTNERYTPPGYRTLDQINPGEALGLTLLSPESKPYLGSVVTLEFSSDGGSCFGYRLDGGVIVAVGGNTTIDGLSLGSHRLVLYTVDVNGGLQATQTIHFTTKMTNTESLLFVFAAVSIISLIIYLKFLIRHKKPHQPLSKTTTTPPHIAGLRAEQKGSKRHTGDTSIKLGQPNHPISY